jgi:hypothetical protein
MLLSLCDTAQGVKADKGDTRPLLPRASLWQHSKLWSWLKAPLLNYLTL